MNPQQAIAALDAAFATKRPPRNGDRLVGVFGNGLPAALLPSMGFSAVDVKMSPEAELSVCTPEIEPYVEPFVDDYARVLLHRLFAGMLDDLHAIVFCRDDASALVAYQYALEFRRQNIVRRPAPKLLLWNMVHRASEPAAAFNALQVKKLRADLGAPASSGSFEHDLQAAFANERTRRAALAKLDELRKADRPAITAIEGFVWRNAGRNLDAEVHADLLAHACCATESRQEPPLRRRMGLIGSATDSVTLFAMLECHGAVVSDLQPFGEVWPGPSGEGTLAGILEAEASYPLCPRAEPSALHRDAIIARCVADRCEIVVSQLDQNDDSVGWDLPSLARAFGEHGIKLVNLGFRDHRPDQAWLEAASQIIRAEVEA